MARPNIKDKITVDENYLIELFDISGRSIRRWVSEDNMPREGANKYDLIKCVQWRVKTLNNEIEMLKLSGDEKLHELKKRETEQNIKTKQVNYKILLGKYVDKKATLIAFSNTVNIIDSAFTSLEHDLIRELDLTEKQATTLTKEFANTKEYIHNLDVEKYIVDEEKLLEEE